MKLFTKNEIKVAKSTEAEKEINFALRVRRATEKERRKLNDIKTFYERQKEKIELQFNIFVNDNEEKIQSLLVEVKALESRKKAALEPVDKMLKKVQELLDKNEQEKVRLDSESSTLEVRDAEVNAKQVKIITDLGKLEILQMSTDEGGKELAKDRVSFKKEKETFSAGADKREELIKGQYRELAEKKESLKQEKAIWNKEREMISEDRDEIEKEWRIISDQRATLERAFARLK